MRLCPACGNSYPDDANFCPMDATRLPPPAAAPADEPPPPPSAESTLQNQPSPIAGRFLLTGPTVQTPTGALAEAQDGQTNAQVMLKLVAPETLPSSTMADRALRELKQ